jgi:DUF4097 and DUF4098 domain-containing protein YvlB
MSFEDDQKEKLPDYQQFLKENKNENTEKAQSAITNNNNIRINNSFNNFKTEIKNSDFDKKKIQFGFVNKKADDEILTVEEDTKGKTEEQIEDYQMIDEDRADFYNDYDIEHTMEVKCVKKLFHPNFGECLLTAGRDNIIKLWKL